MRWGLEEVEPRKNAALFLLLFFLLIQIAYVEMKLGSFRQDLQVVASDVSEMQDKLLSMESDIENIDDGTADAFEEIKSRIIDIERELRVLVY